MIRDPSDGSVKEKGDIGIPITERKQEVDSGLPFASTKPEQQARIERSREWLNNYRLFHRTTEPARAPIGHQGPEKDAT